MTGFLLSFLEMIMLYGVCQLAENGYFGWAYVLGFLLTMVCYAEGYVRCLVEHHL
jgi:hypothetical protein